MVDKTISNYRILEKLGSGGMGVVYKAEDSKLKRSAALKFLPPDLTRDPDARERFVHEAQAASALDHPNICTIYEIGETKDEQMFIAMAYYGRDSLKEKIAAGALPIEDAIDIAIKVAGGLARAHEEEIIHRDIKPANIMITERGDVKIVDFGLAKLTGRSELTKSGATLGTAAYMSPEQAQGAPVDHRTDIWALGVVLYEMLTGQQPFKGENEMIVLYSIVNEEQAPIIPTAAVSGRSDVPAELHQIVDKALAKAPDQRYQSLDEMIMDLKSLTRRKGESKRAKPTMVKRRRIGRKMFYSGAAALIVLLVLGSIYLYQVTKADESTTIAVDTAIKPVSRRIAVLPFINISQDPEDEYFADGMTEELINTLAKISELQVLARTAVMRYKNTTKSVTEIGEELQVGTVLEGSVRPAANRVLINVKLVDTRSQEPLWSQDYNRDIKDVFAIQSEIAKQLTEALRISVALAEEQRIEKKTTENLEAYTFYLRGRYLWNTNILKLDEIIKYYQQALEKDPNYAQAYAGLAFAYGAMGYQSRLSPDEAGTKMKTAALKAIKLDETLAQPYVSLAGYKMLYEWDWSAAEKLYKQAITLNPNDLDAHSFYAGFLKNQGRHDESLREEKVVMLLDPLSGHTHVEYYFYMGRYDEAIEEYQKMLERNPNRWRTHWGLGRCFEQKGMMEQAVKAYQQMGRVTKAPLACVYAKSGRENEARQIIAELKKSDRKRWSSYSIAIIYFALGDKDQGFHWLEKAYELHSMGLLRIKIDFRFQDVRQDPRFLAFLKKMGFEE